MSKGILLDVSPTGVQHYAHVDPDGEVLTLVEHTPSSVEQTILDDCARKRSLVQRRGAQLQHAASVPINTHAAWKREWREHFSDVYTWQTFLVMKLNSRDNCNLRTGYGRGAWGKKL